MTDTDAQSILSRIRAHIADCRNMLDLNYPQEARHYREHALLLFRQRGDCLQKLPGWDEVEAELWEIVERTT